METRWEARLRDGSRPSTAGAAAGVVDGGGGGRGVQDGRGDAKRGGHADAGCGDLAGRVDACAANALPRMLWLTVRL